MSRDSERFNQVAVWNRNKEIFTENYTLSHAQGTARYQECKQCDTLTDWNYIRLTDPELEYPYMLGCQKCGDILFVKERPGWAHQEQVFIMNESKR